MSAQPQLTLFVTITVAPPSLPALLAAHRPVWAACAAEPACLLFDVFHDPASPGRVRFVEVWAATREWFETVQLQKAYYKPLWEQTEGLWTRPIEIEYWERAGEGCAFREGYLDGGRRMD